MGPGANVLVFINGVKLIYLLLGELYSYSISLFMLDYSAKILL